MIVTCKSRCEMGGRILDVRQPVNLALAKRHRMLCWYKSFGNGGNKIRELIHSRDATLFNGAKHIGPIARKGGYGAIRCDGSNDYGIVTGIPADGATNLTVNFWVRSGAASDTYLVAMPLVSGGSNGFDVRTSGSQLRTIVNTSVSFVDLGDGTVFANNLWHFVAVTYDGSTVRFYRNAVLKNSAPLTGTLNIQNDGELNIGRFGSFGAYSAADFDDVRVFAETLSDGDLRWYYDDDRRGNPKLLNWLDDEPAKVTSGNRRRRLFFTGAA